MNLIMLVAVIVIETEMSGAVDADGSLQKTLLPGEAATSKGVIARWGRPTTGILSWRGNRGKSRD